MSDQSSRSTPHAMTLPAHPSSNTAPPAPDAAPTRAPQVQAIEFEEFAPEKDRPATRNEPVLRSVNPLHSVRTTLHVRVGSASVTVGELMGAVNQQVLVLDRKVDQAIDLLLDGQVVARGQLVAVGDQFGVRITELPVPLSLDKTVAT